METKTYKKILATVAMIIVIFAAMVTSASILNSDADMYNKILSVITVIGVICISASNFKRI